MPHPVLSQFLYTSLLCADVPATCVADIVRHARQANAVLGMTGILVFDGQAFCQYVEGPKESTDALLQRLQRDSRHTRFTLQHQGSSVSVRRFGQWSMGYALAADLEPLERLHPLRGPAAVDALQSMIPDLDLGPVQFAG
ncbi:MULTISPECIES: BLUF domain-containing protein [unclassified Acidovorax]|uniref:BLUF domain-containing protein n=1 Tax=unclassified Acidovorax TaxID=2684926 RepID=UPI0028834865|nr:MULTISPECIES: BLUF domain-containing protein [unclassified Acidovorax]